MTKTNVHIGFKAHLGWVAAVVIPVGSQTPGAIETRKLELFANEDREAREPYHIAGGWQGVERAPIPEDPDAVIRRGREKQLEAATKALRVLRGELGKNNMRWTGATVLTGCGHLGNDLKDTVAAHAHIHVAEGDAVRDALRGALKRMRISCTNQDEKGAISEATTRLNLPDGTLDKHLKTIRPHAVADWTKEHRNIAAAAWLSTRV